MHANSLFYLEYGSSLEEVNAGIGAILQRDDAAAWIHLIEGFRKRGVFDGGRADGKENALTFLRRFGGRRIVHGHVPIHVITGQALEEVSGPLMYCDGLCVNVDGALSARGRGFVYTLPGLDEA